MKDEKKLLPCPFCDSYNVKVHTNNGMAFVLCNHCGAVVSFRANEPKQNTVAMWNGRQPYIIGQPDMGAIGAQAGRRC